MASAALLYVTAKVRAADAAPVSVDDLWAIPVSALSLENDPYVDRKVQITERILQGVPLRGPAASGHSTDLRDIVEFCNRIT